MSSRTKSSKFILESPVFATSSIKSSSSEETLSPSDLKTRSKRSLKSKPMKASKGSKNISKPISKVTLQEALTALGNPRRSTLKVEDLSKGPLSLTKNEEKALMTDLQKWAEILHFREEFEVTEATKQRFLDSFLKTFLLKYPLLAFNAEKPMKNLEDNLNGRSEVPIGGKLQDDEDAPPMLDATSPLVMICELKKSLGDATAQVLALLKTLDYINLMNGINISRYYAIITDLKLWAFLQLKATSSGYEIYQTREDIFWASFPDKSNPDILKMMDLWFHNATDSFNNREKINPTTPSAYRFRHNFKEWKVDQVVRFMKKEMPGTENFFQENEIDGLTLMEMDLDPKAFKEMFGFDQIKFGNVMKLARIREGLKKQMEVDDANRREMKRTQKTSHKKPKETSSDSEDESFDENETSSDETSEED
eukprot:TRINITY_DN6040_c0_g1_i1.p1 TRINITY_DN6040_c0_g1~~TRINITY_DN6040_c0_g1_i1.p1  ORF type:complete len:423 (+),score=119.54 TRINITY_DN6040_c0_g1_i1:79-1347(+)